MAVDLTSLGVASEPITTTIEADRTVAYAAATNDPNPRYASGELAPPVFGVVPVFEAMGAASAGMIPSEYVFFIVHGEGGRGLPPNYTIFGQVLAGQDVVNALANVPVEASPRGERSVPTEDLRINRVTVEES